MILLAADGALMLAIHHCSWNMIRPNWISWMLRRKHWFTRTQFRLKRIPVISIYQRFFSCSSPSCDKFRFLRKKGKVLSLSNKTTVALTIIIFLFYILFTHFPTWNNYICSLWKRHDLLDRCLSERRKSAGNRWTWSQCQNIWQESFEDYQHFWWYSLL